jgi:hypothetical protein
MHPIGSLIPRLFPALLVITAAVLITALLTEELEPAGSESGDGVGTGNGSP